MLHLLQLLKMLTQAQREQFFELFSDLDYELNDLGWKGNESDLINGMLLNHFGFSIEDQRQLEMITQTILSPHALKSAVNVINLQES